MTKESYKIRRQKPVACHGFGQDTQHEKRLSFYNCVFQMYYILDGKKIRELMEQQNMNVSKLSELSGVSQSCIRNILNEKAMSTRINTAMHLVGALNMDAETITCEDLLKLIKEVNV